MRPFPLVASSLALCTAALAKEEIYPLAPGLPQSPDYQLHVNQKPAFVSKTPAFSFASFGTEGPAKISVRVARPIVKAVVRPISLEIKPTVQGDLVSFELKGPAHVALELDSDLRRPLFLFANPPEKRPARNNPNVRIFEGGKIHEAGKITLSDNQSIYLAGGAVVRGEIRAERASNIQILGPGILDCSLRENEMKAVFFKECKKVEMDGPLVLGNMGFSISAYLCEDVSLKNSKVLGWRNNDDGFDPDSSRRVRVENCFFRTKDDCIAVKAHGRLNLDPSNLPFVDKQDPSKPQPPPDAYNTEDVEVRHSTFWSSDLGHAMTIGSAVSAPRISNIRFIDCDVIKKEKGPALSIDNHDFGTVDSVLFENIRIEEGCGELLKLQVLFSEYSFDCPASFFRNNPNRQKPAGPEWNELLATKKTAGRGKITNVVLDKIQVQGETIPETKIRGWVSPTDIEGVRFKNITMNGKKVESRESMKLSVKFGSEAQIDLK